jgi:multidrug transporter EmrE-like cation transporter
MSICWLMAVGAGVANSCVALAGKAAEHNHCRAAPYSLVAFTVAGFTAWVIALGGGAAWGDWRLWAFGGTMGALYLVAIAAMLHANRWWPPSIVWSAANMAFVLPILVSALLLGEELRRVDGLIVAGVALMLAGLANGPAPGSSTTGVTELLISGARRWLLLAMVFGANGALMLGYKLFGVVLPGQRSASLVAVVFGCGAALAAVIQGSRGALRVNRAELGWGLAAGTASSLSALALLMAMELPAAAAFPVIQGVSLAGGVLLCALVFGERLTLRKMAALVVGLGTMTLTMVR